MTLTHDQIRAALDHRIRAAGLDVADAIPDALAAPETDGGRQLGRRRATAILVAAAVLVAGAIGALGHHADHSTVRAVVPATESAPSTTAPPARSALPPPWPRLEVRPPDHIDVGPPRPGEDRADRIAELDRAGRAQLAATGRIDVVDQLTGELVNVDQAAYLRQSYEVLQWLRNHLAQQSGSAIDLRRTDLVAVFTDGSFRIVYSSDLDCRPMATGNRPPACAD